MLFSVSTNRRKQSHQTKNQARNRKPRGQKAPRTAEQYFAKPARFQDMWTRVENVIAKMRTEQVSLKTAAREIGINPRTVKRWGGSALRKSSSGRYTARPGDQLLRVLKIPTPDGPIEIGVRGSRQASTLGEYWAAVHKYIATGDASGLEKFRGKQVKDANGKAVPLLTNVDQLNRLGSAGILSFESLYARSA